MPRQQLKDALNALHQELESGEELTPDAREALVQAAEEIQEALADDSSKGGPAAEDDAPLSERVSTLIEDLEASYPRFAEILAKVSDALANLGI